MADNRTALSFESVTMRYPRPRGLGGFLRHPMQKQYKQSLSNVTFSIQPGERVALLGSNGAGKTTLLKLAGGLLYPGDGAVRVNGHDTTKENDHCRMYAGYVINEDRSFYWRLTGRENLRFFAALDHCFGDQFEKRAEELFDILDLTDAAERRVSGYSSGMRQRLSIARGLFSRPDLLLLDEPTRSLDPKGANEIRQLINRETADHTILLATHSFEEAQELCQRILILKDGNLIADCSMDSAINNCGSLKEFYYNAYSQQTAQTV